MVLPVRNMTTNPCPILSRFLTHPTHGGCPGYTSLLPNDIVVPPDQASLSDYVNLYRQFGATVANSFYPTPPVLPF